MIISSISAGELLATGGIWLATEIHNLFKGHAKAQQQLILDEQTYCPPVMTLPDNVPEWKIQIYKNQCKGVEVYLRTKVPERKLLAPITPDVIGPPAPEVVK